MDPALIQSLLGTARAAADDLHGDCCARALVVASRLTLLHELSWLGTGIHPNDETAMLMLNRILQ